MSQPNETGHGQLADEFLEQVGGRIRELRRTRAWTVQELADRSDISRRLLTQIEHGQANPSLVAMTRIARALGGDVTSLLAPPESGAAVEVVSETLVWSSPVGSTAHLLCATTPTRRADLWRWSLVPGDGYDGQPDAPGSQELFHVLTGTLRVEADGASTELSAGTSARLSSDRAYRYVNSGTVPVTFVRVVALTS